MNDETQVQETTEVVKTDEAGNEYVETGAGFEPDSHNGEPITVGDAVNTEDQPNR